MPFGNFDGSGVQPQTALNQLRFPRVLRYRFVAEALTRIELARYAGSAWRGLIAGSLRRTACITQQPTCEACLVCGNCAFFQLFEIAPPPTGDYRHRTASHPFVLDLRKDGRRELQPGDELDLGITLIGEANGFLPNLVYALIRAGENGLGRGHGRFALRQVWQEQSLSRGDWGQVFDARIGTLMPFDSGPVTLPEPFPKVFVDLVTPLRIKRFGRFVGPAEFQAADFLRHLCWRLDTLDRQFSAEPPQGFWDRYRAQIGQAPPVESRLRWLDWTRYSSRQATTMQLGGLVGTFELPGAVVTDLWSLLWLGQWVHVGKGTSFGLGVYRLRPPPG